MKPLVLGIGVVVLAIWSLVAWIGHAVLEAAGSWGSMNADMLPVPPEWVVLVSETLGWATDFSAVIVITIWTIGAVVIGGVTLIGAFLAGRVNRGKTRGVPPYLRR